MRQLIITTFLFLAGLISEQGQSSSEETYCIKLKRPSNDRYFIGSNIDSISIEWRANYEEALRDMGKLLSRFNEEPLTNSNHEIVRSITFGAVNYPKEEQIMRMERWGGKGRVREK